MLNSQKMFIEAKSMEALVIKVDASFLTGEYTWKEQNRQLSIDSN